MWGWNTLSTWGTQAYQAVSNYASTATLSSVYSDVKNLAGGMLGVADKVGLFSDDATSQQYVGKATRSDASSYVRSAPNSKFEAGAVDLAKNYGLTPAIAQKWQSAQQSNIPSIRATMKRIPPIPAKGVTIDLTAKV